jgi:hypothetical protein
MGSVELLVQHQVQELLLVVGNFEPLRLEREISFVTPPQDPFLTKNCINDDSLRSYSWPDMERYKRRHLQDYKDLRAQ